MKKLFAAILAALLLGLAACGTAGSVIVKTGFVGSSGAHSWSGRFKSYNGSEAKQINVKDDGDTLVITYELTVEAGELRVRVEDRQGQVRVDTGEVMSGKIHVAGAGRYLLRVVGEEAKNGSFALNWEIVQE